MLLESARPLSQIAISNPIRCPQPDGTRQLLIIQSPDQFYRLEGTLLEHRGIQILE